MGRLFSGLNAVFLGLLAALGVFFNIEQRRMDNYDALYRLISDGHDADWSLDQEAVDAFSNSANCKAIAGDPGMRGFDRSLFTLGCPLTNQQRFILGRLVEEKRARDSRATVYATITASEYVEGPPRAEQYEERDDAIEHRRAPMTEPEERLDYERLLQDINADDRDRRRTATAILEQEGLGDPQVLSALVHQVGSEASLDRLSAQGRYNVLYLLNRSADRDWPVGLADDAADALALIRERARTGRSAVGDQTRAELQKLEAKIERLGGQPTSAG